MSVEVTTYSTIWVKHTAYETKRFNLTNGSSCLNGLGLVKFVPHTVTLNILERVESDYTSLVGGWM